MKYNLEVVIDAKASLGEGPHWDEQKQALYWVDIIEKRLHVFNPSTKENQFYQFEQYIGAAVPGDSGQMVLAMQNGLYQYELESGDLTLIANPEEDKPSNRFNDGKCDPYGRFYVGTMDLDAKAGKGAFYRLDRDGKVHTLLTNLTISNGIAFSPEGDALYHIDTPTGQVSVYQYDEKSGDITFEKIAVQIPEKMGSPDGMTIDREGMVWIAHWGGACVTRWNPHTGQQLDKIEVPALNVTSCTFGGADLNELFITTARQGMSEAQLSEYPLSGGVFKVTLDVSGFSGYNYQSLQNI